MPGLELHGLAAEIGKRDGVGPEEIPVFRRRALRQKARDHLDFDLPCYRAIRFFNRLHGDSLLGICRLWNFRPRFAPREYRWPRGHVIPTASKRRYTPSKSGFCDKAHAQTRAQRGRTANPAARKS